MAFALMRNDDGKLSVKMACGCLLDGVRQVVSTPSVWLALFCGGLMQFAFSPYDWAVLGIVLPALVLWLARRELAFAHGYAFGIGWFGIGSWWLIETFHLYGQLPIWVGALIVGLIGLVMGLFPALWISLSLRIAGKGPMLLVVFPAVVVLLEWLRGHLFTGLPWTTISNILLDTPAIGWASVLGVYGLALLPALLIAALALLSTHRRAAYVAVGLVLMLTLLAPAVHEGDGEIQQAALIQGNVPQDQKWDRAFLKDLLNRYLDLSSKVAKQADVIIWPESAVPFFPSRLPEWDQWILDSMAAWHRPVLYGGDKLLPEQENAAQNGLYLFNEGERSFSGKHHLVPFGEYVPAWLPFIKTVIPAIADFQPADDAGVLRTATTGFGVLICYESIFPEEARARVNNGADVLVVASNDAWYGHTPAVWQHTQAARMRAVETGRYLLRVGNTGITAVIGTDGKIQQQLPWWQADVLLAPFRTNSYQTFYVRWGDWPALLLSFLLLLAVGIWKVNVGRQE